MGLGAGSRLVTGKPLVAVCARGGAYGPGSGADSWDQQCKYLKHIFGFIGFTDIREIFVEPTEASLTSKDEAVAAARRKAAEMATHFDPTLMRLTSGIPDIKKFVK